MQEAGLESATLTSPRAPRPACLLRYALHWPHAHCVRLCRKQEQVLLQLLRFLLNLMYDVTILLVPKILLYPISWVCAQCVWCLVHGGEAVWRQPRARGQHCHILRNVAGWNGLAFESMSLEQDPDTRHLCSSLG